MFTPSGLALATGIAQITVYSHLKGKRVPTFRLCEKYAKAFGLRLEPFLRELLADAGAGTEAQEEGEGAGLGEGGE